MNSRTKNQKINEEYKEALRNHASRNLPYLLDRLNICYSDRGNGIITCQCPCANHGGDRSNSNAFSWRPDIARWICWSHHCEEQYGSDIFGLIRSILDIGFNDTIAWIIKELEESKIDITEYIARPERQNIFHVHEPLKEDAIKFLIPSPKYLLDRGFDSLVLQDYQVGLWQRPGTFMHDRVVFPIRDHEGFLVGYTGRTIHDESFFKERGLEYYKWVHSRHYNQWPKKGDLHIGSILFNLNRSKYKIGENKCIILVEGPLDGMKLEMAGIHNWCATLGTAFCSSHRTLLVKYGINNLYVAYDNDLPKGVQQKQAGEEGWQRLQRVVGDLFTLHRVKLPENSDCGDLSVKELQEIFNI